jgi:ABC-2 type transport system permease protein
MNGVYGLGGELLMMRQAGTLQPYRLTPVSGGHVIASRLMLDVAVTVCVGCLEIAIAIALYGLTIQANPFELLAIAILGVVALGTLGALIVAVANTIQEASMLSQVVFLALLILSGLTMRVENLPEAAQAVARFLPTTMLVSAFNGVLINGDRLIVHWREIVVLVFFAASTGAAAVSLFRWDKDEKVRGRSRAIAAASLLPLVVAGIWFNLG